MSWPSEIKKQAGDQAVKQFNNVQLWIVNQYSIESTPPESECIVFSEKMDDGSPVDVVYLDFAKSLMVYLKYLFYKINFLGIENFLCTWIENRFHEWIQSVVPLTA